MTTPPPSVTPPPLDPIATLYGHPTPALLNQLTDAVVSGLRASADVLSAHPSPLAPLIADLFDTIRPLLHAELHALSLVVERVLLPPATTPLPAVAEAARAARSRHHATREAALDAELAAARAALRDADARLRALREARQTASGHVHVLRGVQGGVGRVRLDEAEKGVGDAEGDYRSSVQILSAHRGAREGQDVLLGAAAAAVTRKGDDEHAPLQHFSPAASSVLSACMGAGGMEELSRLKDALTG